MHLTRNLRKGAQMQIYSCIALNDIQHMEKDDIEYRAQPSKNERDII